MDKMRKWEKEYNKYKNGEMNDRIEELKKKVQNKKATKEEYNEYKKIQKIESNIYKVTNVLELRDKLIQDEKSIKQEIERLTNLEEGNKQSEKIEKEFTKIDNEREIVRKQLKSKDLSKEEKEKLDKKWEELNTKLSENNEKYRKNQEIFSDNKECKNKKLMGMTKEELNKRSFDIGTKVSKCNMVARNLMNGLSWDAIEINLDNWKEKKYTSKEKLSEKAKGTELDIEDLSEKIIKTTKEQIKTGKTETDNSIGEKALAKQSIFLSKHPRLAKIVNFVKNKWNKTFGKSENNKETKKGSSQKGGTTKKTDDDFKKYLKDIAEKGMEQVKKEKLENAKQEAHKRETEKFGKDYADKSYKINDEGR